MIIYRFVGFTLDPLRPSLFSCVQGGKLSSPTSCIDVHSACVVSGTRKVYIHTASGPVHRVEEPLASVVHFVHPPSLELSIAKRAPVTFQAYSKVVLSTEKDRHLDAVAVLDGRI